MGVAVEPGSCERQAAGPLWKGTGCTVERGGQSSTSFPPFLVHLVCLGCCFWAAAPFTKRCASPSARHPAISPIPYSRPSIILLNHSPTQPPTHSPTHLSHLLRSQAPMIWVLPR